MLLLLSPALALVGFGALSWLLFVTAPARHGQFPLSFVVFFQAPWRLAGWACAAVCALAPRWVLARIELSPRALRRASRAGAALATATVLIASALIVYVCVLALQAGKLSAQSTAPVGASTGAMLALYAAMACLASTLALAAAKRASRAAPGRRGHWRARSPAGAPPLSPHGRLVRHQTDRPILGPTAHDVADRQDANRLGTVKNDQMAKAAAHHRAGGLLQRPVGCCKNDVTSQMRSHGLPVGVLSGTHRHEDVALGDDPRTVPLRIHDHGRPHAPLGHQPRDRAQGVPRPDRENHATHAFVNLHSLVLC